MVPASVFSPKQSKQKQTNKQTSKLNFTYAIRRAVDDNFDDEAEVREDGINPAGEKAVLEVVDDNQTVAAKMAVENFMMLL